MNDGPMGAQALERRVKRWLRSHPFDLYVQTAPGLEGVLAHELRSGGFATDVEAERGGVSLRSSHADTMRANLVLRTAGRVLLRLASFTATTPPMLFDNVGRIAWEVQIGTGTAYRLKITSRASRLQAGDGVRTTVERAIAKRLRSLGLDAAASDDAPVTFHVRFVDDRCTVSLDTSGEHLHRRGVRTHVHDAPIRETVAAGLALSAYGAHDVVVDPFCGSGTLLLETADLAAGRPPGRARRFAFERVAWHRPGRWREVQRLAAAASDEAAARPQPRLVGIDIERDALAAAAHNLSGADHRHVELLRGDAGELDLDAFAPRRGLLIANLPFGIRLGDRAAAAATILRFLRRCTAASAAWDLALLTTHPDLVAAHPGVRVSSARNVESGGLGVSLVLARTSGA